MTKWHIFMAHILQYEIYWYKGDSLWNIAKKYYKDGRKYVKIAEKNNIKKPYTIYPNQRIIIP